MPLAATLSPEVDRTGLYIEDDKEAWNGHLSLDPVQDILEELPDSCAECWEDMVLRAKVVGGFLCLRGQTLEQGTELVQQQAGVCEHLGQLALHINI